MCDNCSKVKDIVEFGSYPFEEDGSAKPIKWIILKLDGNKALLLSAYGLDAMLYNEENKDVTWETCALRRWLNEDFYDAAFTEDEKNRIVSTNVKNSDNPEYNTPGGNDTEDRIFLLSINEAEKYLTGSERRLIPAPYAAKQGELQGNNGNCWWWLRSPGINSYGAACVDDEGSIRSRNHIAMRVKYAVCPALWIEMES